MIWLRMMTLTTLIPPNRANFSIEARHPNLIPAGGVVEVPIDEHRAEKRQKNARVQSRPRQELLEPRRLRELVGNQVAGLLVAEMEIDEVQPDVIPHIVQHEGRHKLARLPLRLEDAGEQVPGRAHCRGNKER